jgi:hypothetical protein
MSSSTYTQGKNQGQNYNNNSQWQQHQQPQKQGQATGQDQVPQSGGYFSGQQDAPAQAPAPGTAPVHRPIFDQIERASEERSKFVKIESGQSLVLYFDPDKIRLVDREINDKKSKAAEYDVVDVNTGAAKILTLSLSWARQLNELLKNGYNVVKITRRGSGFDTQYTFIPAQ